MIHSSRSGSCSPHISDGPRGSLKSWRWTTKLKNGFPKFNTAVNANDWTTAADESHRNGISDERNEFVHDLFMAADGE